MPLKTFKIHYKNPKTEEWLTVIESFEDTPNISAEEWAEDYAYAKADNGYYRIEEI